MHESHYIYCKQPKHNFSSIFMCVTATWATEKTKGQSDQPGTISSEADKGTWRGVEAT